MTTWHEDNNGNRCSEEYFGSAEAAKAALASLVDCEGCADCVDCEGCEGCVDCADCVHCVGCVDCADCEGCEDCKGSVHCEGCVDCGRCVHCVGCVDCADCVDCTDCVDCEGCKGREGCVDCEGCEGKPIAAPVIERIHSAVYSAASAPGALDMSAWHTCGTTHCRAGWVVTLAGEAGAALEKHFGAGIAAKLIYAANGYRISMRRFYDSDDDALADMRALAEGESK